MISKKNKTIALIVIVLAYAAYVVYCEMAHDEIVKNGKYTVAKVTDFKTFRNGYSVYYEYTISNVLYSEKMHVSYKYENIIGEKYFAKFNPEKPKNCFIILDKPALPKFWNPPPDGWKNIP